jgi:two-component sensor histidine kinase
VIWGVSGPIFQWSDTWQLIINTLVGGIEIRTSEHLNWLLKHRARVHERTLDVDRSGSTIALCDVLAARFGRSGGPRLTCVAADEALPIGAVTLFALIADLLVTAAFVHAFPPGRGGRIAVSFTAAQEAWQLTVDDSGIAVRSHGDRRDDGPTIARQLVLRLG